MKASTTSRFQLHGLILHPSSSIALGQVWKHCEYAQECHVPLGLRAYVTQFQYLQLIRYSTEMFLKQRQGEKLLEEGQENLDVFQRSHDVMENRIRDMKAEIIKLKEKEAELKRFKEKEPAIRHYLGVVSNLAKYAVHSSQLLQLR